MLVVLFIPYDIVVEIETVYFIVNFFTWFWDFNLKFFLDFSIPLKGDDLISEFCSVCIVGFTLKSSCFWLQLAPVYFFTIKVVWGNNCYYLYPVCSSLYFHFSSVPSCPRCVKSGSLSTAVIWSVLPGFPPSGKLFPGQNAFWNKPSVPHGIKMSSRSPELLCLVNLKWQLPLITIRTH